MVLDLNAFLQPLVSVLAVAAVFSIGLGVIRDIVSSAAEDDLGDDSPGG